MAINNPLQGAFSGENRLRNVLIGAGVAAVGAIGAKAATDYLRNRGKEEPADESRGDQVAASADQVTYAVVEDSSLQRFLDASFGDAGRYVPTRPPKVFDYQGKQYMVVWAYDNKQNKNQMLAFAYTEQGRKMIASVGYTNQKTDYNVNLGGTPFAVEIEGNQISAGQGETRGADEVDLVLAGS